APETRTTCPPRLRPVATIRTTCRRDRRAVATFCTAAVRQGARRPARRPLFMAPSRGLSLGCRATSPWRTYMILHRDNRSEPPHRDGGEDGVGHGLSGVAIRRPVFTVMLMLALIVLGI